MNTDSTSSSSVSFPFKELFSASSIIFYQCKVEENFPLLFISDNVSDILGIKAEEFYKDDQLWIERIHPDDRDMVIKKFEKVVEDEVFAKEYRFKHGEGHSIWLYDEVKLVTDEEGKAESIVGSSIEITDRKRAEENLYKLNKQLEQRIEERTADLTRAYDRLHLLEMAIANINDMVIITKASKESPLDSKIVFVNDAFEQFTGYTAEEAKGESPTFLHGPETSDEVKDRIQENIKSLDPLREEFINYKKDGTPYWIELDMAPFPAENEDEVYWVGINRNITPRKEAEHQIRKSLKEKEVLLAEIHHRVKNNLAIISGLLDLQAFNEEDSEVLNKFRESQARIQSIAMVHEKLYQSHSLSSIEMNTYIDQLTDYISEVFEYDNTQITFRNNADPIELEINTAVPCGLILNELITNAFKHAFAGRDEGVIEINFQKEGQTVTMEVKDDGVGLPEEVDFSSASTLGLTLVETLMNQLGANLEVESGNEGTSISIRFEMD